MSEDNNNRREDKEESKKKDKDDKYHITCTSFVKEEKEVENDEDHLSERNEERKTKLW